MQEIFLIEKKPARELEESKRTEKSLMRPLRTGALLIKNTARGILAKAYQHRHKITAGYIGISLALTLSTNIIPANSATFTTPKEPALLLSKTPTLLPTPKPTLFPESPPRKRRRGQIKITTPLNTNPNKSIGGWLLNGVEKDFGFLRNSIFPIDEVSLFWLEVGEDGISLKEKFRELPYVQVRKFAEENKIKTYLVITADPTLASVVLADPNRRKDLATAITNKTKELAFLGAEIDFELLGKEDAANFNSFLLELKESLKSIGATLAVDLEARLPNDVSLDWQEIGKIADKVRIMAYDYHSRSSPTPGAISPIGWVKEVIEYSLSKIPAQKIFVGLPVYGYDWLFDNQQEVSVKGLTYADVQAILSESQAQIQKSSGLDERGYEIGKVPYFSYTDKDGKKHMVWFEDKESILEKVELIKKYNVAGIYFWRLNAEDSDLWPELKKVFLVN